jgi:hypothetical protein
MNQERFDRADWQRDLQWVSVFLRAVLGSLFLSAGITKLPGGIAASRSAFTRPRYSKAIRAG